MVLTQTSTREKENRNSNEPSYLKSDIALLVPIQRIRPSRPLKGHLIIPIPPLHPFILLFNHGIVPWIPPPQILDALLKVIQLACPSQAQCNDQNCQRKCRGPVHPLSKWHVANIGCVHAHDTGDSTEWKENNGDDGECVDCCFLPVFVRVYLLDVLDVKLASPRLDLHANLKSYPVSQL